MNITDSKQRSSISRDTGNVSPVTVTDNGLILESAMVWLGVEVRCNGSIQDNDRNASLQEGR